MTKPATLPRWASTTGDVPTGNMATPSSGQQDSGWTVDQDGISSYENWKAYWLYEWCKYLNSGAMDGAFTFNNTVQVTGILSALSKVYATTGYYGAAGAVALFPAGISSTLMPGFSTAVSRTIPTIHSTDHVAGAVGTHHARVAGGWTLAANTFGIYYPVDANVGDVITGYTFDLTKVDNLNSVTSHLISSDVVGGDTLLTPGYSSGAGPGFLLGGEGTLAGPITVAASTNYAILIVAGGTTNTGSDLIGAVRFTWHR